MLFDDIDLELRERAWEVGASLAGKPESRCPSAGKGAENASAVKKLAVEAHRLASTNEIIGLQPQLGDPVADVNVFGYRTDFSDKSSLAAC